MTRKRTPWPVSRGPRRWDAVLAQGFEDVKAGRWVEFVEVRRELDEMVRRYEAEHGLPPSRRPAKRRADFGPPSSNKRRCP